MKSRLGVSSAALILLLSAGALSQTPAAPPSSAGSIEQDLLVRLKGQSIGQGTLDSVDVPEEFLRRVADRIVRMDYQKRYRMVLKEDAAQQAGASSAPTTVTNSDLSEPTSSATKRIAIGVGILGGLAVIAVVITRIRCRGHA